MSGVTPMTEETLIQTSPNITASMFDFPMDLLHSQDPLGLLVGPWASKGWVDNTSTVHPRFLCAGFYQYNPSIWFWSPRNHGLNVIYTPWRSIQSSYLMSGGWDYLDFTGESQKSQCDDSCRTSQLGLSPKIRWLIIILLTLKVWSRAVPGYTPGIAHVPHTIKNTP